MCVIWGHGNDLRFWAEFLLHASFPKRSFPSFSGRNHEAMKAHGSVWTGVTWAATAAECFRVFMWFVQAVLEKAEPPQHDGNDPAFPHLCLSDLTTPQQKRPVSRGMPFPPGPDAHFCLRATFSSSNQACDAEKTWNNREEFEPGVALLGGRRSDSPSGPEPETLK